jgi:hypothetical protein
MIYQREPVFTIGQAPFVAGAIYVRNQMRVLKQRERARRHKALIGHIPFLRGGPSRNGMRRDSALRRSPAIANT